eukprot:1160405-Amphidinium_carterae.2
MEPCDHKTTSRSDAESKALFLTRTVRPRKRSESPSKTESTQEPCSDISCTVSERPVDGCSCADRGIEPLLPHEIASSCDSLKVEISFGNMLDKILPPLLSCHMAGSLRQNTQRTGASFKQLWHQSCSTLVDM